MRIGELAARGGASVRSLRYYEEQGLLTLCRSPSGQRHYTEAEVERVVFIQRLYAAGLSSPDHRRAAALCGDAESREFAGRAREDERGTRPVDRACRRADLDQGLA